MNTLTLPSALMEIEEEAFAGTTSVQRVCIGSQVRFLGAGAFSDMPDLLQVEFANDDIIISDGAFDRSHPYIVCRPGSKAEEYAGKNGLPIIYFE